MHRFEKRLSLAPGPATQIYGQIAAIDAVKGHWQLANRFSPQVVERLQTSVLVTSTGASTRIEGSKLSDEQVQALFRRHRITRFKTRDEQEVGGYLEVLQRVFEQWADIPFSQSAILSLHSRMLGHSDKDARHKGALQVAVRMRVEARDRDSALVGVPIRPNAAAFGCQGNAGTDRLDDTGV